VSSESDVSLAIFDLLGREVTQLLSQHLKPGTHSSRWDASLHSSGIYLCRLIAGSRVKTTVMLLAK
ncbi:MAG: T9SS type A sorting domain-containing protein, partial [bacterium]